MGWARSIRRCGGRARAWSGSRSSGRGRPNSSTSGRGETCSAQEALFHYFGLPLDVLVEPSEWYSYHRKPTIVEANKDGGPGAGPVRGDELVGRGASAAPASTPCGMGAGRRTGSGPARAGTSPRPRRGWRSGSGGSGDREPSLATEDSGVTPMAKKERCEARDEIRVPPQGPGQEPGPRLPAGQPSLGQGGACRGDQQRPVLQGPGRVGDQDRVGLGQGIGTRDG